MTAPARPSPTTAQPPASSSVSSAHGRRTTRLVGVLRASTILCAALAFASAGFILAGAFGRGLADTAPQLWFLFAAGALGAALASYTEIVYGVRHARLEEKALRERLLRIFFTSALKSAKTPPARQISLMTDSLEQVTEYRQVYWGATVASVLAPMLILLYVMVLDWVTGLLILLLIPLVPAAIWLFFRYFRKVSGNSRAKREALSVSYLDAIRQLVLIRLFGAGERIEASLRAKGEQNRHAIMKLLASNQLVIIVMDAVFLLFLICWSVFMISWRSSSGALTVGEALSVLLVLPLLLEPLAQVAGFFYIGMGGRASQRVLNRVLAGGPIGGGHPGSHPGGHPGGHPHSAGAGRRPSPAHGSPIQGSSVPTHGRPASAHPRKPKVSSAEAKAALDLSQAISVRKLNHDFGRGAVLKDFSLDIPHGAKVAVVGPSGVGKSTLLSLLRGTLAIQDGAVAVNGAILNDLAPEQAPRTSASVSQSTWLFTGTIADNLRFAHPDASEAEIWQALERAQLAQEVRAMPHGLATDVGESGSRISGGQAQRLSLARAFLTGRKVILLDEPTSQIDGVSEQKIIESLANIGADTTLVMVTHRQSLLTIADTVLTLTKQGFELSYPKAQGGSRAN